MTTGSSYWDRLFEKIQNILSALSGGEPVINDNYQNVQSSFWKMLFEKLDTIIVAIVSSGGGGGGTTDHRQLLNRSAANQHPMSAITGLEDVLEEMASAAEAASIDVQTNWAPAGYAVLGKPVYVAAFTGSISADTNVEASTKLFDTPQNYGQVLKVDGYWEQGGVEGLTAPPVCNYAGANFNGASLWEVLVDRLYMRTKSSRIRSNAEYLFLIYMTTSDGVPPNFAPVGGGGDESDEAEAPPDIGDLFD